MKLWTGRDHETRRTARQTTPAPVALGALGERAGASKWEKNFAADLMHQQCWCWGRDVGTAENLLLRFGFTRHRRPGVQETGGGGTRYEWSDADGTRVALWGFGMWLRLPGGEQGFFARYERGVRLLPKAFDIGEVHTGKQIEPHQRRPIHSGDLAIARKLATAAATWCERYERWVQTSAGKDHRQQTLTKWKHAVVDPDEMPDAWRRVRTIYEKWYATPTRVPQFNEGDV